jgi:hypothetical protein
MISSPSRSLFVNLFRLHPLQALRDEIGSIVLIGRDDIFFVPEVEAVLELGSSGSNRANPSSKYVAVVE